ncbi:hypothetical protein D8S78_01770 [Natrialba swarupiae]|nr:hypothetical protein [Natrialba swarupiae]
MKTRSLRVVVVAADRPATDDTVRPRPGKATGYVSVDIPDVRRKRILDGDPRLEDGRPSQTYTQSSSSWTTFVAPLKSKVTFSNTLSPVKL